MNNSGSLSDLTLKDFLASIASKEPVPGGGSVSALCGSLGVALAQMVTNLTLGKKKYADVEEDMEKMASYFNEFSEYFIDDIDTDSEAYNNVFSAFALPKETDEEKEKRAELIQTATKLAAKVPLHVAKKACMVMDAINIVARLGNSNAVTDACVAMMCARTAVLGALLNVRINLLSINDEVFVEKFKTDADELEKKAIEKETELLEWIKGIFEKSSE